MVLEENCIMPRVHATSWYPVFWAWMDSWTRRSAQSVKSEPRAILINVELKFKYHPCWRMDLSHGLWFPEAQTATWMNPGKIKKSLLKTLRWWVLQALSNHTRWRQALRKEMRWSDRHNRAQRWIVLLKNSSRLTSGSGMTFLPLIMSKERASCLEHLKEVDDVCTTSTTQSRGWWSSLVVFLDVISNAKVARTFSDSQWLGCMHGGSDQPRF